MATLNEQRNEALSWHHSGLLEKAESAYHHILKQYPKDGETWHYLAVLCGQTECHSQVIIYCDRALECGYQSPALLFNKARAFDIMDDPAAAADAAEMGLLLEPDDIELTFDLIDFLKSEGREGNILLALKHLAANTPANAAIHTELGNSASRLGDIDTAEAAFQKVVEITPTDARAWANLATFFHMSGEAAKAEASTRRAIALDSKLFESYFLLAELGKQDKEIFHLTTTPEGAASAHMQFAAASISGETGLSFRHYAEGNRIVRSSFQYNVATDENNMRLLASLITDGDAAFPPIDQSDKVAPVPIFIVGMPRSGSTLLEQILASHSDIGTAGELVWLQRFIRSALDQHKLAFPLGLVRLNEQALTDIRAKYMAVLQDHSQCKSGTSFVIDKLPANFLYIPLIAKIFPASPIIVSARDSLETCWSCYTHLFSGPQFFAYDMEELARYCKACNRLITHYRAAGLKTLYTAEYEKLVENPAREIAKLLNHCGLEMETQCLNPERAQRLVQTASSLQVRAPILERSEKKTDRYIDYIGPLVRALKA
ncbi:MAG: hypothetical protein COB49_01410 [Alphaproteobacteria bacterium]|nr:MAG: hypothetical protein COB49_01410 [Alphaproteobacteria bacterium]